MFLTPYNTTSLKDYKLNDVIANINKTMVAQRDNEYISPIIDPDTNTKYPSLQVKPAAEHIPAFVQPILLESEDDDKRFIVDMRPFTRSDRLGNISINSALDYKLNLYYSILSSVWVHNGNSLFEIVSTFPARVFVQWLSGIITRTLNLDMVQQVQLKAILGAYYCLLHKDSWKDGTPDNSDEPMSSSIKRRLAIYTAKVSFSNPHATEELIKDMPLVSSLPTLIEYLHSVNSRYEALTLANLYAMVSRSWFGANAPTLCAVALEYPPAFNTMVYFALNYRGLNKTGIGTIVDNGKNSAEAKQFKLKIEQLIDDSTV